MVYIIVCLKIEKCVFFGVQFSISKRGIGIYKGFTQTHSRFMKQKRQLFQIKKQLRCFNQKTKLIYSGLVHQAVCV